jgi:hypothetical protein
VDSILIKVSQTIPLLANSKFNPFPFNMSSSTYPFTETAYMSIVFYPFLLPICPFFSGSFLPFLSGHLQLHHPLPGPVSSPPLSSPTFCTYITLSPLITFPLPTLFPPLSHSLSLYLCTYTGKW